MAAASPTAPAALPQQLTMPVAAQALSQLGPVLLSQPGPTVVLDAQPLHALDSSAVAVLLDLRRQLLAQGKNLQLLNPPQRLQQLLRLYGVADLLPAAVA